MTMIKTFAIFLLVFGLSATAQAHRGPWHWNDHNRDRESGGGSSVAMPEPSAIPELGLCMAGLGFVAFFRRKSLLSK